MQLDDKEKDEMILIPKTVWLQLLEVYDKQNNKFVSVFKTVIICATILICVWVIGYFTIPRINQNNGIIQNGNINKIDNATVENNGGDK